MGHEHLYLLYSDGKRNCQGSDMGSRSFGSDGKTDDHDGRDSYWNYDVAPTQYVIYGHPVLIHPGEPILGDPGESAWTWMAGRSKLQGLNREEIRLQNPPPLFVPGKAGLMIRMKPYQGDKMNERIQLN